MIKIQECRLLFGHTFRSDLLFAEIFKFLIFMMLDIKNEKEKT